MQLVRYTNHEHSVNSELFRIQYYHQFSVENKFDLNEFHLNGIVHSHNIKFRCDSLEHDNCDIEIGMHFYISVYSIET